jgi:hypothetical protein
MSGGSRGANMAINQSSVQDSVRTRSGSVISRDYNSDWHYLWDEEGIAAGPFNSRMLLWINVELGSSYTDLTSAMQAYAESLGFYNWSSMTAIDPGVFDPVSLFANDETGYIFDLSDASTVLQERSSPSTPSGNGDPIGTLLDLSPNAAHLVAPADGQRPTYNVSGENGWAQFDSASNTILSRSYSMTDPTTYVFSFRYTDEIAFGGAVINGNNFFDIHGFRRISNELSTGCEANLAGGTTIEVDEDVVVAMSSNYPSDSWVAKNDEAQQTGTPSNHTSNQVHLGSFANSANPASIRLYRVVAIGRFLTSGELSNAIAWCGAPAGLEF